MKRLDRYSAPAIDVMLVAAVAVVAVAFVYWLEHGVVFAVDFRSAYLPAADAVRHGVNPFPAATDPSVDAGSAYVYPPLLALVLVPFTALPELAGVGSLGDAPRRGARRDARSLRRSGLALLCSSRDLGSHRNSRADGERVDSARVAGCARLEIP